MNLKYILRKRRAIIQRPAYYLRYLLKSLRSCRVEVNRKTFLAKYRPFWERVGSGDWEKSTFDIFDRFLDDGHSYIDIGAWIGPTVLYGCQIARHCYAVEPDPVAFRELLHNVNLNRRLRSTITLSKTCISDRCGKVAFGNRTGFGDSISSQMFSDAAESVEVESVTLEKYVQLNEITDCSFVKMDIEGGETIVVPKSGTFLAETKPTLYISLHPQFFKDVRKDALAIVEVLETYRNLYTKEGESMTRDALLSGLLATRRDYDVVATEETWDG